MHSSSKLESDIVNTLLVEMIDGDNEALSGKEIHERLSNPPDYLATTLMRITAIGIEKDPIVIRDAEESAPRFRLVGSKALNLEILKPRKRRNAA